MFMSVLNEQDALHARRMQCRFGPAAFSRPRQLRLFLIASN